MENQELIEKNIEEFIEEDEVKIINQEIYHELVDDLTRKLPEGDGYIRFKSTAALLVFYIGNQQTINFVKSFKSERGNKLKECYRIADDNNSMFLLIFNATCQTSGKNILGCKGIFPNEIYEIKVKSPTKGNQIETVKEIFSRFPENKELKPQGPIDHIRAVRKLKSREEVLDYNLKHFKGNMGKAKELMYWYMNKPRIIKPFILENPYPWQRNLDIFTSNGDIHDRLVIAFVDMDGSAGKDKAVDSVGSKGKDYLPFEYGNAGSRDLSSAILKEIIDETWNGKYLLINIPRSRIPPESFYTDVESLTNGKLFSGKYNSMQSRLDHKTTVIMMMNTFPNLREMSSDRWIIIGLQKNQKTGEIKETLLLCSQDEIAQYKVDNPDIFGSVEHSNGEIKYKKKFNGEFGKLRYTDRETNIFHAYNEYMFQNNHYLEKSKRENKSIKDIYEEEKIKINALMEHIKNELSKQK